MKGLILIFSLFFAICYSTNVYLTAYYAPSCGAASGYAILKFNLTSGSCSNSGSNSLLLNVDGSVSFFSSTNCSGNNTFSVTSGSTCVNGTFVNYKSFSQAITPGVYIQDDHYQDSKCSIPTNPFNTYLPNATNCLPVGLTSSTNFVAIPAPNVTLYYYARSATCSSSPSYTLNLAPGCNTVREPGIGNVYLNIDIQDFPVPITTASSVTGSSSSTGATGSTTRSSSSSDSNVFYPSLFLLISLFLTSLF